MRKSIYFAFIMIMFSISLVSAKSDFVNNYGVFITSDNYQRLSNLGFNDYEINQMDEQSYDNYKDLNGKIVDQKEIYMKTVETYTNGNVYSVNLANNSFSIDSETYYLSESEYYSQLRVSKELSNSTISPQFAITKGDTYKHMTLYLLETNNGYKVKNTLVWDKLPLFRTKDLMSIEVDNSVYIKSGSREGRQNWTLCNKSDCYSGYQNYDYNSTSWKEETNNVGRKITLEPNLKNDEQKGLKKYVVEKLDLYVVSDIEKENSNLNIILLKPIASYQHQVLTGYENFEIIGEFKVNW